MGDAVDKYMQQMLEQQHIPGMSLAVVRENQPVFARGYGLAQVELDVPATENTIYEIASITKPFTATAVMQLVEQDKLTLADRISTHLPDLPSAWSDVTVQHILMHQSGIHSYTNTPDYWKSTRLDISREEILSLVADLPLDFVPGERVAYDNTGYYLLGMLIEAISGQSYGDYLTEHIFTPLNMTATRINDPYTIVANRAGGYTYQDDRLQNKEYYSPSGTYSAGVLLSSVVDLAKWAASFYTNTLLSEASRTLMWTPHPSKAQNEREFHYTMGLGWFLVDLKGRLMIGHNGGIVGFTTSFSHFPDEKLSIILLCNRGQVENPHIIAHRAAALL